MRYYLFMYILLGISWTCLSDEMYTYLAWKICYAEKSINRVIHEPADRFIIPFQPADRLKHINKLDKKVSLSLIRYLIWSKLDNYGFRVNRFIHLKQSTDWLGWRIKPFTIAKIFNFWSLFFFDFFTKCLHQNVPF